MYNVFAKVICLFSSFPRSGAGWTSGPPALIYVYIYSAGASEGGHSARTTNDNTMTNNKHRPNKQ